MQGSGDTWTHRENQCWQEYDAEFKWYKHIRGTNLWGGFTSWTVAPTMKRIHLRDSWEVLNFCNIPNLLLSMWLSLSTPKVFSHPNTLQLPASSSSWVLRRRKISTFVSHSWHGSPWQKILALITFYNSRAAICLGCVSAVTMMLLSGLGYLPDALSNWATLSGEASSW